MKLKKTILWLRNYAISFYHLDQSSLTVLSQKYFLTIYFKMIFAKSNYFSFFPQSEL